MLSILIHSSGSGRSISICFNDNVLTDGERGQQTQGNPGELPGLPADVLCDIQYLNRERSYARP
jgi:hypothetical protein